MNMPNKALNMTNTTHTNRHALQILTVDSTSLLTRIAVKTPVFFTYLNSLSIAPSTPPSKESIISQIILIFLRSNIKSRKWWTSFLISSWHWPSVLMLQTIRSNVSNAFFRFQASMYPQNNGKPSKYCSCMALVSLCFCFFSDFFKLVKFMKIAIH